MQNALLLAALAAVLVLGWHIMKKLDGFLENSQNVQMQSNDRKLRIGFSNPMAADSITDTLEKISLTYPDVSVSLFYGTEDELVQKLSADKLDIIFLHESKAFVFEQRFQVFHGILRPIPVVTKYGGLPVEPITDGCLPQSIVWQKVQKKPFVFYTVDCLRDDISDPES